MSSKEKYVPKHRGASSEPALKKGLRKSLVFSGVAVVATGIAVSSGVADRAATDDLHGSAVAAFGPVTASETPDAQAAERAKARQESADRERTTVSRSGRREAAVTRLRKKHLDQDSGGQMTRSEDLSTQDPRDIARAMLPEFGFDDSQFSCLDQLYVSESDWDIHADNPTSSAYGIPQALPGEKMASAGPDWAENPATQIRWGLGYIASSYGTPCNAWSFKQSHNWY